MQPVRHRIPKLQPTDRQMFLNRRRFIHALGVGLPSVALGTSGLASCGQSVTQDAAAQVDPKLLQVPFQRPEVFPAKRNPKFANGRKLTPREVAAKHNNFYEFLPNRGGPVYKFTDKFIVEPWTVEVTGACLKPRKFDLDDLFKFEHEERVYHFRCVETWAMTVPWSGFPLSKLLDAVEPKSDAKFVRFSTAHRPDQMPGLGPSTAHYKWPYYEALRMDEARNELTMLATGIYSEPLLKQHGAPIRLVCPWKYGYKSPKSIVKIELLTKQPATFWNEAQPAEYGFLSNVNPNVPHPRWSQAEEYLLDAPAKRLPTKVFNGYGDFVASLYPNEPTEPLPKAPAKPR